MDLFGSSFPTSGGLFRQPWAGAAPLLGLLALLILGGCGVPEETGPVADRAEALLDQGQPAAARELLFPATREEPRDARLRRLLGLAELALGDLVSAEASLRRAMDLGAEPAAAADLARVLLTASRPREVLRLVASLEQELEQWPLTVRIDLAALQAEAELALKARDPRALTRRFAGVWRLRDTANPDADLRATDARLATLAATHAPVRHGREHARCQVPAALPVPAAVIDPGRRVLRVGPGRELKTPRAAAAVAQPGDVIEIDAATYPGDVALWNQDGLLLRGVGGRPVLDARGRAERGEGIWVFRASDITVENVAFRGARGPDRNAAGIRFYGTNLTVRGSEFTDNENGILTWNDPGSRVLVEFSTFAGNGDGKGYAHNIYVGQVGHFTLRFSWSHGARGGHAVKSRAAVTEILYNRLTDEEGGRKGAQANAKSSYLVDIPEGGTALVMGNVLQKGWQALNPNAIAFASENQGTARAGDRLTVLHNAFFNQRVDAAFVANRSGNMALVASNLLMGGAAILVNGPAEEVANFRGSKADVADGAALDFAPGPDSPLVDAGADLVARGADLPEFEYLHPAGGRPRPRAGTLDIGPLEFCGW